MTVQLILIVKTMTMDSQNVMLATQTNVYALTLEKKLILTLVFANALLDKGQTLTLMLVKIFLQRNPSLLWLLTLNLMQTLTLKAPQK
jgi:hypothetical protein